MTDIGDAGAAMHDLIPVKKNRVSEEVVSQIQRLIYEGHFGPGDRLPTERELSETLEVSKTTLREALFILQTMGYIVIQPRNGIYVKSPIPDTLPQPVRRMFKVGPEQLFDILEALEALAPDVAFLAAERATPEDLEEMEVVLGKFKEFMKTGKLYSSKEGRMYNTQLYSLTAQASKNPLLIHLMNFTIEFIKGPLPFDVERLDDMKDFSSTIFKQMQELFINVRDGEPKKARATAQKHLTFVKECLRQLIDEDRKGS
jgi:GntR family transcriptional repressor for pyruvate dehydrogenase complex